MKKNFCQQRVTLKGTFNHISYSNMVTDCSSIGQVTFTYPPTLTQ